MHQKHYWHLLIMAVLSFISMYILMYAMVDSVENVYMNINQFYMAGLMTAPMIMIELIVMRGMYMHAALNAVILAGSVVTLIACFIFIRLQTGVHDAQFLKSMIPHHASAILMCENAPIQNPDIQALCQSILQSQQSEIDQMKRMLEEQP